MKEVTIFLSDNGYWYTEGNNIWTWNHDSRVVSLDDYQLQCIEWINSSCQDARSAAAKAISKLLNS